VSDLTCSLHPRELLAAEPDINEVSHEERFSNFDRARVWGEAEERQAGLPTYFVFQVVVLVIVAAAIEFDRELRIMIAVGDDEVEMPHEGKTSKLPGGEVVDVNDVGDSHLPIDFRVVAGGGGSQEVMHKDFAAIG